MWHWNIKSLILLWFISIACGQRTENVMDEIIDTSDEMSMSFWRPSRDASYAQSFTQFFEQIQRYSSYVQLPEKNQLSFLQDVEGVWYTLWNELTMPPIDASIKYSTGVAPIDYLTIRYTLCGESWVKITATKFWDEHTLKNTVEEDGKYTCDGLMRQVSFNLDQVYGVEISLFANTSETPCFAMVDRIETATEIGPTTPTTRATRDPTTPKTTTATPTTTTLTTPITESTTIASSQTTEMTDFSTEIDTTPADSWTEITISTNGITTASSVGNTTVTTTTTAGGNTGGSSAFSLDKLMAVLVFIVPFITFARFEKP